MKHKIIFSPYKILELKINNRFVMAPMTRSRSTEPGEIPNELMAKYYAQRAGAGLIITEATQISKQGQGYARTPGIYTHEQIEGWRLTTNEVHKSGGKIFLQLWHVGRVSNNRINSLTPMAPSAIIAKDTSVYFFESDKSADATFIPTETPIEMTRNDIEKTINDFVEAAKNAIKAGFDGVEIHAANGYLIDQFLRSNSNTRTDEYGGNQTNRIRFLIEVTEAVTDAIGHAKTGVRLSPFIKFKDMDDPEILDTIMLAVEELNKLDIAYLHLCEADWEDAPKIPSEFRRELRKHFHNTIIATGNKSPEEGEALIKTNCVDLIGFGRKFISNPDYPNRILNGFPLSEISNTHELFGGGTEKGYSDYKNYEDL